MGNMLESDSSSNNSDTENTETKPHKRTAGDGMECSNNANMTIVDLSNSNKNAQQLKGGTANATMNSNAHLDNRIDNATTGVVVVEEAGKLAEPKIVNFGISPRQMPSKEFLIPVKPPRMEANGIAAPTTHSFDKISPSGKQRNPKFVPYEPYSCATRPILVGNQTHTRKPSDSSSIISQNSTLSMNDSIVDKSENSSSNNQQVTTTSPGINHSQQQQQRHSGGAGHQHHASATLWKERLKMAEKEISDLQSENSRLKKLVVDSMAGGVNSVGNETGNSNCNAHGIHESFDNLNDEIEVWRSKFLSSCVLVEQTTKQNHELNEAIADAKEIIKELKENASSLTQRQYETINEWLRKTNQISSYSSTISSLPDVNCNNSDEYLAS